MPTIVERFKKNWLVAIFILCAGVVAATWTVFREIILKPRDYTIDELRKKNEDLKNDTKDLLSKLDRKEKEITDSTKAIITDHTVPGELVVEFPWVDTASAPGHTVAAAPYLHGAGITVADLKPQQSEVVLINNRGLYRGKVIIPGDSQNFLTQTSPVYEGPASFTLRFNTPCDTVKFTRPALYAATESGITHPAWSAHALDTRGVELSSQSETLTQSLTVVPARTYSLNAPGFEGIAAVRFDSDFHRDGKPFAAFRAIIIERLTLVRRTR